MDKAETCAAEYMLPSFTSGKYSGSQIRELQFRVYPFPRSDDGPRLDNLLVVLQYSFAKASPAGSCWSVTRVVHLVRTDGQLRVTENRVVDGFQKGSLSALKMIDADGDGVDELWIEPVGGGAVRPVHSFTYIRCREAI
jgi:hypothetical protein